MKHFLTLLLVALVGSLQAETPAKKSGQSNSTNSKSKASSSQKSGSSGTKSSTSSTKPNQKSGVKSGTSSEAKSDAAKTASKTETKPEADTDDSATEGPETEGPPVAAVSSIEVEDIQNFEHYAPQIQELIRQSLALTKQNLTYTFGSADPKKGGMDCSGTIYYVLHEFGFKDVPRQSNEMAGWVKDKTLLNRVEKADTLEHPEFASLQPGNLLFWSGTYAAGPREIPVTHVMIYLGKLKKGGKHVVFGASDGRAYQGKRRTGVSVFDFSLPRSTSSAKFYGYGMIPGVGKITPKIVSVAAAPAAVRPEASEVKKTEGAIAEMTEKSEAKVAENAPVSKPAVKKEKVVEVAKADQTEAKATSKKATAPSTQLAEAAVKEEVRPAVRVDDTPPQDAAKKEEPAVTKNTSAQSTSSAAKTPTKSTTKSTSTAAKRSTPSKSNQQSRSTTKRRAAPPPEPSAMEKAKRGVGNFVNGVRRAF